MKITTNLENWTGEKVTINVNQKKRSFTYCDTKVTLVLTKSYRDDALNCNFYDIMVDGDKWGVVVQDFDDGTIEAYNGDISSESLSRRGDDIYSASVKMISNF
jgi:hypothetical protein